MLPIMFVILRLDSANRSDSANLFDSANRCLLKVVGATEKLSLMNRVSNSVGFSPFPGRAARLVAVK